MNDLMNEFESDDAESLGGQGESWREALGGLLKEVALASTDSLTRRLRRVEEGITDENVKDPMAGQSDGALNLDETLNEAAVEQEKDWEDKVEEEEEEEEEEEDEVEEEEVEEEEEEEELEEAAAPAPGLAKRMLNWSAGTVISNLADNDELDALIDRQLRKRLPQLARDPQVQELIRAQAGMYLEHLLQSPQEVQPLVQLLGNWYIAYLREHPEPVQGLIREQAGEYLAHLGRDTSLLEPLVQSVAGKYIAHIGAHPEQVQELIQQQAGTYLVHLTASPAQVEPLVQTIAARYLDHLTAHPEPVQKLIKQEADKFIADLEAKPEQIEPLVKVVAGRYLKHLETHPEEVEKLVQLLADRYIFFLRENPHEVNLLVRQVGDEYIDYLHEHPDQVQDLIQSQSLNMGAEVMEEVRERTVTADSFIELLARSLLRRTPREQLPEPSAVVQMRAVNPRQTLPPANPGRKSSKENDNQ